MDCGYYEQLMSRMLDEELSGEELKNLYAHLRSCPDCRRIHAAFRDLSQCLRDDLAEVPEGLAGKVMEAVNAEPPLPRPRKSPWRSWLVTAACAALVIGVGMPLFAPKGASDSVAESEAFVAAPAMGGAQEAPAARAVPEEMPAPEAAAPEAVPDKAADPAQEEPAEAAPMEEAPEAELASEPAPAAALSLDGLGDRESVIADSSAANSSAGSLAATDSNTGSLCPVYDRQGVLLGHLGDTAALLALCLPGGEPLALTEFEADYNIDYGGLVYQFLVHEGALWWRSDGESLLLPCGTGPEALLALIQ